MLTALAVCSNSLLDGVEFTRRTVSKRITCGTRLPLVISDNVSLGVVANQIDYYTYALVSDLRDLDAVETGGWRLERWRDEDVVMAYEMDEDGKWRASHYYRPGELWEQAEDAPRRAAKPAGEDDAV